MTLAIGVMGIGSEYRHKTITSTFLATPRRVRVMVAKVVSLLGSGAFYGLIFLVGSVGVGATVLTLRGLPAFPETGPILRTLALSLLVLGLWGADRARRRASSSPTRSPRCSSRSAWPGSSSRSPASC